MTKQTIVRLIDDLSGDDAHETVAFQYEGVDYTIDLSTKNAARLRKALKPYTDKAERVSAARQRTAIEDTTLGRTHIRNWARANGHPNLPMRGRIPRDVVAAYRRANRR